MLMNTDSAPEREERERGGWEERGKLKKHFSEGAGSLYLAQQLMYIYLTRENAGPHRLISSHDAQQLHISRCIRYGGKT